MHRYAPPLCTAMHDALLWGYRYAPLCTPAMRPPSCRSLLHAHALVSSLCTYAAMHARATMLCAAIMPIPPARARPGQFAMHIRRYARTSDYAMRCYARMRRYAPLCTQLCTLRLSIQRLSVRCPTIMPIPPAEAVGGDTVRGMRRCSPQASASAPRDGPRRTISRRARQGLSSSTAHRRQRGRRTKCFWNVW